MRDGLSIVLLVGQGAGGGVIEVTGVGTTLGLGDVGEVDAAGGAITTVTEPPKTSEAPALGEDSMT